MSELINTKNSSTIRRDLLITASAMAILGLGYGAGCANASDSDTNHPTVWIELGGQLEQLSAGEEKFAPAFVLRTPRPTPETIDPLSVGHPPRSSFGEEGKITFQPDDSSWSLSASIRYGRSNANQHVRQQSPYSTKALNEKTLAVYPGLIAPFYRQALQFIDVAQKNEESHAIVDFQAGKDVGLGMFGRGGNSFLNFGIRFAQFTSKTNSAFKSDPDAHVKYFQIRTFHVPVGGIYHSYQATALTTRSFMGVGPSLSWNASAPLIGNPQNGEMTLDWGANAAVLFGRQKVRIHHHTVVRYHYGRYNAYNLLSTVYHTTPPDLVRSRMVTVPNIGGFAGVSFNYGSGQVSLGYRADLFFGAVDGGIDTRKSENVGFYGPFATISVGIGG